MLNLEIPKPDTQLKYAFLKILDKDIAFLESQFK